MARGRMISRTLGSSRKFSALQAVAGKLTEFAQSLYPMLVTHADDWGRQSGDAFTVKHAVFPTSPRRESDFSAALVAMAQVGLIEWYNADGVQVIQIVDFSPHQPGLRKRPDRSSRFPVRGDFPPIGAQITPLGENSSLRELNLTELNRTEPIQSSGADAPAGDVTDRGKESPDLAGFIARFCELFPKYRNGAKYHVQRQKDIPLARRLLMTYPRDELEHMAVILLTTDDEWISQTDRGIGILSTKATKLADLLAAYRAKRRGVA